jgi:K+-transporting ATPase c subunit
VYVSISATPTATAFIFLLQSPEANPDLCVKVGAACGAMSSRSARALRELSLAVRTMTTPSPPNDDMPAAIGTTTASDFMAELSEDAALLQAMHVAAIVSLLSDIVTQIERISEAVDLARLARFDKTERTGHAVVVNVED